MIAKHVPTQRPGRSSFVRLVKYMIAPMSRTERLGEVTVTNCASRSVEKAMLEVFNTQLLNKRAAGDKTYHLVVSFPAGEVPEKIVLKAIEERLCSALGFSEHQRISAVHHDTDHLHIHIAINKIHPTRHTMHEPFNAYFVLGELCSKLEREFGLQQTNHSAAKSRSENQADDLERHAKVDSLLGYVRRECSEELRAALTWVDLHKVLNQKGVSIQVRANGLVFVSEDGVMVKASSVARGFSKKALEGRLGAFIASTDRAGPVQSQNRYEKRPKIEKFDSTVLYARYTAHQYHATLQRAETWSKAKAQKDKRIADAKRNARLKRALIKTMITPALARKVLYATTSKALRDEITVIQQRYRTERKRIFEQFARQSWADWLRTQAMQGDAESLKVLRQRPLQRTTENSLFGTGSQPEDMVGAESYGARVDSVTKRGTVIYTSGRGAIRDTGVELQVSAGADRAAMEVALRMAIDRYGGCLAVNGSAVFQEEIARAAAAANLVIKFDNQAIELRRQHWTDQFTAEEERHANNANPGRHTQGSTGRDQQASAGRPDGFGDDAGLGHTGIEPQSDAGKRREAPAPESGNGVRDLSQLGVVHFAQGSAVLLPGNVPNHLEHGGPQSDHELRRGVRGERGLGAAERSALVQERPPVGRSGAQPPPANRGRLQALSSIGRLNLGVSEKVDSASARIASAALMAAEKYVFEREQKRAKAFDIPKHSQYSFANGGIFSYAGLRFVDGQALALLKRDDEIAVLPIDQSTANTLKRKRLGAQLSVSGSGTITSKGRGR